MIRPACQGDAASFASLMTQLGYPTTTDAMRSRLSAVLGSPSDGVFVAESQAGEVVGSIHVMERRLLEVEPFGEIMGLIVDASQRGGGVGGLLTEAAEDWARGRGVATLRVRSNVVRERAHQFYLNRGYVEVKRQAVFNKPLRPTGAGESDHAA